MRVLARVLAVTMLAGAGVVAATVTSTAQTDEQVYLFTGEDDTFVVPANVCQVHIDATGGNGGDAVLDIDPPEPPLVTAGGLGGKARATVPVTPGETLQVQVGAEGADGGTDPGLGGPTGAAVSGGTGGSGTTFDNGGGGGGGSSAVSRAGVPLVGAGGGGGAGGLAVDQSGVDGGEGGNGGGAAAEDGADGVTDDPEVSAGGTGGGSGSIEGGDGADNPPDTPTSGGGGGGGGGFNGGGGGESALSTPGGGGGGGASAIAAGAAEIDLSGFNPNDNGDGDITISWTPGLGCAVEAVIRFTG